MGRKGWKMIPVLLRGAALSIFEKMLLGTLGR